MASVGIKKLWRASSKHRLVLAFSMAALAALLTPIQHFVALGRYQHYGIAIFLFGTGYLAQSLWARKRLKKWAIISYLATGLFFVSVGLVFFSNPWLDCRVSVQTAENDRTRGILIISYLVLSIILALIWTRWIISENSPVVSRMQPPDLSEGASNNE